MTPTGAKLTIGKDGGSKPFSGAELIYLPDQLGYGQYAVDSTRYRDSRSCHWILLTPTLPMDPRLISS